LQNGVFVDIKGIAILKMLAKYYCNGLTLHTHELSL
jgi:hypothetical protein